MNSPPPDLYAAGCRAHGQRVQRCARTTCRSEMATRIYPRMPQCWLLTTRWGGATVDAHNAPPVNPVPAPASTVATCRRIWAGMSAIIESIIGFARGARCLGSQAVLPRHVLAHALRPRLRSVPFCCPPRGPSQHHHTPSSTTRRRRRVGVS